MRYSATILTGARSFAVLGPGPVPGVIGAETKEIDGAEPILRANHAVGELQGGDPAPDTQTDPYSFRHSPSGSELGAASVLYVHLEGYNKAALLFCCEATAQTIVGPAGTTPTRLATDVTSGSDHPKSIGYAMVRCELVAVYGTSITGTANDVFLAAFNGLFPSQDSAAPLANPNCAHDAVISLALADDCARTTDGRTVAHDMTKVTNPPGPACSDYAGVARAGEDGHDDHLRGGKWGLPRPLVQRQRRPLRRLPCERDLRQRGPGTGRGRSRLHEGDVVGRDDAALRVRSPAGARHERRRCPAPIPGRPARSVAGDVREGSDSVARRHTRSIL